MGERPNDIPQEVWGAAELEVRRWPLNTDCVAELARAILAERERCAKIAERTYAKDAFHFELGTAVAAAIRTGAAHG